jgi:hypothetical protein
MAKKQPKRVTRTGELKASRPTQAEPGTPEKLAILAERYKRRQQLWNPEDKKRG